MDKVRLNVTEDILERVVYGMENQKDRLLLDPSDGLLCPEADNNGTFIPLPPWGPTEGYRLMDGFAGTMADTFFRKRLLDILHSGSGVFRNFKDALKERPELEGLWRIYKKREMRKAALSWLSRWSDALALENLGEEPEEWDQLSSAEFVIRDMHNEEWPQIKKWNQLADAENFPGLSSAEWRIDSVKNDNLLVAEGPSGEIVGFTSLELANESGGVEGRLYQVYVLPELRGLGIGRMLIDASLKRAEQMGAVTLTVRTGSSGKLLEHYFENAGFSPALTLWRKSL